MLSFFLLQTKCSYKNLELFCIVICVAIERKLEKIIDKTFGYNPSLYTLLLGKKLFSATYQQSKRFFQLM